MNLAVRDIRHNLGRFVLTTIGVGMLLMIVMGMGGIYRGLIDEATLLVTRSVGADLWIVQRDTRGPFAEVSRLPRNARRPRRAPCPGVTGAGEFVSHTIQREHAGQAAAHGRAGPRLARRPGRVAAAGRRPPAAARTTTR